MDHLGARVGLEDMFGISFDQARLVSPAPLTFPFGILLIEQHEQSGIGWASPPEVAANALHVGVEQRDMRVPQHRRQATLEVLGLAQITVLPIEEGPVV